MAGRCVRKPKAGTEKCAEEAPKKKPAPAKKPASK
jgi:hypothetical protein